MPTLPHNFPHLRYGNGGFRKSMLTIGAGMSAEIAPLPNKLCQDKRATAEAKLGITTGLGASEYDLYKWADEALQQLVARNEPNPKLRLAESLDIPTDDCWKGCTKTQRNTPRHRVIARFAREGIWEQIWSLNWDFVQESGLENVGIEYKGTDANLYWPTAFHTFIDASDCAVMGRSDVIKVVKPHGCVQSLCEAQKEDRKGNKDRARSLAARFLITKTELDNLRPSPGTQGFIFASLCEKLSSHPWVIAGWRVSERYLTDYIEQNIRPQLNARPLKDEELSIISTTFNNEGHTQLANCYQKTRAQAYIPVERSGANSFTIDQLFLWVQALYALDCLRRFADSTDAAVLDEIANSIQQPPTTIPFVIQWADSFLPVWVRLCWRCGIVEAVNRLNQSVSPDDLLLEALDEHVPWHLPHIKRPELHAAVFILSTLQSNGHGAVWDYEAFPGGLFRESDGLLVIPLPAWDFGRMNNLRGLKPLFESVKRGSGRLNQLAILPLTTQRGETIAADTKRKLKQMVAREFPQSHYAQPDKIEEFELANL